MRKKVKDKEASEIVDNEPKQIKMPRISPMDEIEYVNEMTSHYLAMTQIDYIKEDDIESEWDKVVRNIMEPYFSRLQTFNELLSSKLGLKEKGLDISTIYFKDFEVIIKEMGLKIDNLDDILDPKKMV